MLVRLTDNDGTHAGDNPRLSLNRGLANWGVNPGRWNRPLNIFWGQNLFNMGMLQYKLPLIDIVAP